MNTSAQALIEELMIQTDRDLHAVKAALEDGAYLGRARIDMDTAEDAHFIVCGTIAAQEAV